jgi:hypothetical protein
MLCCNPPFPRPSRVWPSGMSPDWPCPLRELCKPSPPSLLIFLALLLICSQFRVINISVIVCVGVVEFVGLNVPQTRLQRWLLRFCFLIPTSGAWSLRYIIEPVDFWMEFRNSLGSAHSCWFFATFVTEPASGVNAVLLRHFFASLCYDWSTQLVFAFFYLVFALIDQRTTFFPLYSTFSVQLLNFGDYDRWVLHLRVQSSVGVWVTIGLIRWVGI